MSEEVPAGASAYPKDFVMILKIMDDEGISFMEARDKVIKKDVSDETVD